MEILDFKKYTGDNVHITVIDSGVDLDHEALKGYKIDGFGIKMDDALDQLVLTKDFSDENGHGTAIVQMILKSNPDAKLTVIKIFNENLQTSEEVLLFALQYIYDFIPTDILNLSLGINVCECWRRLNNLCEQMVRKGMVLISAFDNTYGVSYPAAYPSVIGVDTGDHCVKNTDFEYVNGGVINIRAKGGLQRVAWKNPSYRIVSGNSFACAHVSAFSAKLIQAGYRGQEGILDAFKEIAVFFHSEKKKDGNISNNRPPFSIKRAAVFPFQKEMHALAEYSNMLPFTVSAFYDSKYSGNVGAQLSRLLNRPLENDKIIRNISQINWDEFDTLIVGHCDKLNIALGKPSSEFQIIQNALKKGKNVYSFDEISQENMVNHANHFYSPRIPKSHIPINRFGKLRSISTPVLGVCGTSSQQGKFTLQLILRKRLLAKGYSIGQMGSEPTSLLFGMDTVYPVGYNADLSISRWDNYLLVNEILYTLSLKEPDIILFGCQASAVPHNFYNTMFFNPFCLEMLLGAQPDAVVLCINYYDSTDYILRTIHTIEALANCTVIALVMHPMRLKDDWSGYVGSKVRISPNEYLERKNQLLAEVEKNIFLLGEETDMIDLVELIVAFFS